MYYHLKTQQTVKNTTHPLQEAVEETIAKLKVAGIVPWMLTGDKKETAISLAQAAGLVKPAGKVAVQ